VLVDHVGNLRHEAVTEGRNEQQVFGLPRGALGLARRGAFLDDEQAENTAEDHDGQALPLELDEEDAPRLAGGERAELVHIPDVGGILFAHLNKGADDEEAHFDGLGAAQDGGGHQGAVLGEGVGRIAASATTGF
jgi:hypothetical protein